jgi:hypothetical protein
MHIEETRIINPAPVDATAPITFTVDSHFNTLAELMKAVATSLSQAGIGGDLTASHLSFSADDGEANTCPRRGTVYTSGYAKVITLEGVTLGRDALEALGETVPPEAAPPPPPALPSPVDLAMTAVTALAALLGVSVALVPGEPGSAVLELRHGDRVLRTRPLAAETYYTNLLDTKTSGPATRRA